MRDRRTNREISPRYRDRRHHHHVDRRSDAAHRHDPAARLVRLDAPPPPPMRSPPRRLPPRRELIPRHSDHLEPVHREARDYPSPPRHPRSRHSPNREYQHELRIPSYMHPDYPTDLSHGIKHQSHGHGIKHQSHGHGLDPHPLPKPMFLDDRPSRSYPATLKPGSILDNMLTSRIHDSDLHHHHSHARDLYDVDRDRDRDRDRDIDRDIDRNRHRDRDRGRDRETGKGLYQREIHHPITITTNLGPLSEGGQSSYGHGRLCEHRPPEDVSKVALGRLPPDDLRKSRDQVSERYNDLALDDMYGKMPYPSLDCSRVDGTAYSPKTVREGRVYSDLPHHSAHEDGGPIYHEFEQARLARPLHRHEAPLPFEDRPEFHREVAGVEREMPPSPIFPDNSKGCTDYSPSDNGYEEDLDYEPSDERLMTREHQLRHHMHDGDHVREHVRERLIYDDRIFDDDSDDVDNDENGDEDGHVSNARITVKDRLNLSSPLVTDVELPIIRRHLPSRKPVAIHGKRYHSKLTVPAAVRTNSVKKRLRSGPLDLRKENFRAHKMQRRGMDDEPKIRKSKYEYKKDSDEDAVNVVSPTMTDPPDGTDEFNKQLERAFFKYSKTINGSSREKKRYLQPEKGSIVCCVCGRQSKEFSETHKLVVHAFRTKKPGLRTAHLGLHKALCLLMGWNWMISPDESKLYQAGPPGEAKVLKQDLILWPPIVVIRNSSIVCNPSKSKPISIDVIENMLKELGIGEGKAKVSFGIPSNLSVILVKFSATGSGFELAEELHNHFHRGNHGKEHLDDLLKSCTSPTSNKKENEKKIEDVLYGYMAGIEDLENLDSDTKRIHLGGKDTVKSKKVIRARISEGAGT